VDRYSFLVRIFHPLLPAGLSRRFPDRRLCGIRVFSLAIFLAVPYSIAVSKLGRPLFLAMILFDFQFCKTRNARSTAAPPLGATRLLPRLEKTPHPNSPPLPSARMKKSLACHPERSEGSPQLLLFQPLTKSCGDPSLRSG
jgi:hypothetical protein